jgi:integrase
MRGLGSVFKRGGVWYVQYYHRGKRYRESSYSESQPQAQRLLKKRLGEINSGKWIGPSEERVTFENLAKDIENDYRANGKRSLSTILFHLQNLRRFFGTDRAIDINTDRVKYYQVQRLDEKAACATINREVACLGRMFSLAAEANKISRKPKFKLLEGERVRQGFLEHGEFLLLLSNLPDYIKPIVEFLYLSGWRKGEVLKLEWKDVDLESRTVRLRMENSKNKESRLLPLTNRIWELIQDRTIDRDLHCSYVFHHEGKKIGDFRKVWKQACKVSGLNGIIVHDLRRCAARNMSRAGVSEQVAMGLTGHKTNSMYRRYRIVNEQDLMEGTGKLQSHLQEHAKTSVIVPIVMNPESAAR